MIGTIRTYNEDRGFGFIRVSFKEQYFFHVENWRGAAVPVAGQTVEFDLAPGHKPGQRLQAVKVIPAETAVGGAR